MINYLTSSLLTVVLVVNCASESENIDMWDDESDGHSLQPGGDNTSSVVPPEKPESSEGKVGVEASAGSSQSQSDTELQTPSTQPADVDEAVAGEQEESIGDKGLDVSSQPWDPGLSDQTTVTDSDLMLEGETEQPEDSADLAPFANSFDPGTGYQDDKIQVARVRAPAERMSGSRFTVTAHKLNIRSRPSHRSKKVGLLEKGMVVQVSSSAGGWSQIGAGRFVRTRYMTAERLTHR